MMVVARVHGVRMPEQKGPTVRVWFWKSNIHIVGRGRTHGRQPGRRTKWKGIGRAFVEGRNPYIQKWKRYRAKTDIVMGV